MDLWQAPKFSLRPTGRDWTWRQPRDWASPALFTRSKRDFRGDLGRWLWDAASKEAGARLGALFLKKKVCRCPVVVLREPCLSSRPSPPHFGKPKGNHLFRRPRLDTYPRGGQKATWKPAQGRWSVPPKAFRPMEHKPPIAFLPLSSFRTYVFGSGTVWTNKFPPAEHCELSFMVETCVRGPGLIEHMKSADFRFANHLPPCVQQSIASSNPLLSLPECGWNWDFVIIP